MAVEQIKERPGFVRLKATGQADTSDNIKKALGKQDYVSADKVACTFLGHLRKCLRQCQDENSSDNDSVLQTISDRIKLRRHGPAVQMDVHHPVSPAQNEFLVPESKAQEAEIYPESEYHTSPVQNGENVATLGSASPSFSPNGPFPEALPPANGEAGDRRVVVGKLFYSVDMVPTFEIPSSNGGEPEYYVAKPIKDPGKDGHQRIAWRRSFSIDEKRRLVDLDQDNGCRKKVLRMLKVIRNSEPGLAQLTSYHLKTVLFRKNDELGAENWKGEYLGERLMDMIRQLEVELKAGKMAHYYLPQINLLDRISQKTVDHMQRRLKHLNNSEKKMMKILNRSDDRVDVTLST